MYKRFGQIFWSEVRKSHITTKAKAFVSSKKLFTSIMIYNFEDHQEKYFYSKPERKILSF